MVKLKGEREVCRKETIRDEVDVNPIIPITKKFWITREALWEFHPRGVLGPEESYWSKIYCYEYIFNSEKEAKKARDLIYRKRMAQGWKKQTIDNSLERKIGYTTYSITPGVRETQGAIYTQF